MTVGTSDWPRPSERIRELLRRGAETALNPPDEWIEEMHAAALGGVRMTTVADDPVLAEGARRTNLANMLHWAAANIHEPGRRVSVNLTDDILDTARDLVRRGLGESSLDSFRTAQTVAWRRWMDICFGLTDDPAELRELLELSSLSISTFIDDTVAAMSARMEVERADLTRGTHAERRATVALLLEGAPIPASRAQTQLGYRLSGPHIAAVIWSDAGSGAAHDLEAVADAVTKATDHRERLTVVASAAALWIWLPTNSVPTIRTISDHPRVRVAFGRPGHDLDGFRRSHFQALATQRLVAQLASPQQVARHEDVRLVALLTTDPTTTEEFLTDTLGDLAVAEGDVIETVRTWIAEQCNTSRTAERLYAHRNTVIRRLARADELLPRPIGENLVDVAAALEILRWRPNDR
ncbi:PucR family transcriptional regulator [Gordonia sp. SL306]|uniref:PucR family transcriptional regulator n=1 Tax=Gordonia sp. SL306 TaxID=2995145 RepID=UPI002270BB0D|nr:helix-turn-helix domain-containing protein [Gordonia sp. SL306]WAC53592.1 helix-turn-helix domain-containing protein [Gordonia sp. SL306]